MTMIDDAFKFSNIVGGREARNQKHFQGQEVQEKKLLK